MDFCRGTKFLCIVSVATILLQLVSYHKHLKRIIYSLTVFTASMTTVSPSPASDCVPAITVEKSEEAPTSRTSQPTTITEDHGKETLHGAVLTGGGVGWVESGGVSVCCAHTWNSTVPPTPPCTPTLMIVAAGKGFPLPE